MDLKEYEGKVALVVNTASKCGFTPQYKGLQELYTELSPRGFVILGFPSNDFGGQEPGTAEEIKQFCELNYKVTFPMFSKVVTKAGPDQSPIYTWLGQTRQPAEVELQQVRDRQGRQGRGVLPEQGDAGLAGAAAGDRERAEIGPTFGSQGSGFTGSHEELGTTEPRGPGTKIHR